MSRPSERDILLFPLAAKGRVTEASRLYSSQC